MSVAPVKDGRTGRHTGLRAAWLAVRTRGGVQSNPTSLAIDSGASQGKVLAVGTALMGLNFLF
jgi:hypothetical protein